MLKITISAIVGLFLLNPSAWALSSDEIYDMAEEQTQSVEMNETEWMNFFDGKIEGHHGACGKIAFDDNQKAAIKSNLQAFAKTKIQKIADIKMAKVDYLFAVMDKNANRTTVNQMTAVLTSKVEALAMAKMTFVNDVLFIARAEQRGYVLKCMKKMKKYKMMKKAKRFCKKSGHHSKPAPGNPGHGGSSEN